MGATHEGHADHHHEKLLKHLEEDDGHGPANDRPKPAPAPTTVHNNKKDGKSKKMPLQAFCDMKPNKALQRNKNTIHGSVTFTQPVICINICIDIDFFFEF